jgi:hypothetical protein
MSEEFSLGDKDLINDVNPDDISVISQIIKGETERTLINWYSQLRSDVDRSMAIPSAFTTSSVNTATSYTNATVPYIVAWDSASQNSDTTIAWTYSVGSDSYDDPEPKPISRINIPEKFKSKEELFVWIVDLLKSCSFEGCLTARKMVRNTLNLVRDQIKEYFDKPRFECNQKNNLNPRVLVLDFYFNEKDIQVRRCFRFGFTGERKEIEVFER